MRSVRLICAAVMTVATLVAVGATTQSASAAGVSLHFSRPSAIANETIQMDGTLPTAAVRTVRLQYRTGTSGSWTTRLTEKSTSNGFFFFVVKNTKTRYWRISVPAGAGQPAVVTTPKRLAVVPQKVEYFEATNECDSNTNSVVTVWADFYPARPGRRVDFATPAGPRTGFQDAKGIATVQVLTGASGLVGVQATAAADDGAAAKASVVRQLSLPQCDPV
ncbi:hypothetical protein [Aeromicrobium sp. NPDC092404]|uniref:hypothetical protein n=1 Tax=Aeromicrobium sp. NPDC092404 TaxID=3154976 RepID=UPI003435A417